MQLYLRTVASKRPSVLCELLALPDLTWTVERLTAALDALRGRSVATMAVYSKLKVPLRLARLRTLGN